MTCQGKYQARYVLAGQPRRSAQAVANRNSASSGQDIQNQTVADTLQISMWGTMCLSSVFGCELGANNKVLKVDLQYLCLESTHTASN